MANNYHQLSLKDTFSDCKDMFMDDVPSFFQLLEQHFDISLFIPQTFYNAFYQHLGRKREYPLTGFLSALILQKIFPIPTDSLLILLNLCKELRDFCGFSKVPDAPLFTRFRLGFSDHIELMFQQMVDYTEPICQQIDSSLAQMLTFDTSGIELYVTENNPKTLNALIRRLKAYYKDNPEVDPYMMAYGLMPSQAASSPHAKQQYINGHFCYADKFAILTNGLGIIRHITFLDDDFKQLHPEIPVVKKSDSPDEDKSIGDSTSLKPVLSDFFALHPHFQPNPTCPKDPSLDMKYLGPTKTWISASFRESRGIRTNGNPFIKSGRLWNGQSTTLKSICVLPSAGRVITSLQRQMYFWPGLPASLL